MSPSRSNEIPGFPDEELRAAGRDAGESHEPPANVHDTLSGNPVDPVRLGRFVIIDRIGQGGMGLVYRAYDSVLDRKVAIKLLLRTIDNEDEESRKRLRREAQALARLSHPNVVPLYDVRTIGKDDIRGMDNTSGAAASLQGRVFLVMEYIEGQTLHDWVTAEPRLWQEILARYRQAGLGLAAAHAVGLVHRDFKPSNALVGDDGRVRVVDFGLARGHLVSRTTADDAADDDIENDDREPHGQNRARGKRPGPPDDRPASRGPDDRDPASYDESSAPGRFASLLDNPVITPRSRPLATSLTVTGDIVGTPAYMAPEQFSTALVGPRTDQFSFCVSLFEALYGQRPFHGRNLRELERNASNGEVDFPLESDVPEWLVPILRRGLSPSPDQRYESMDALLAALNRDPIRRRQRWQFTLVILATLVMMVGFYVAFAPGSTPTPDLCSAGEAEIATVWSDERRDTLERAFRAIDDADALRAWPGVRAGLDAYAEQWVDTHRNACVAHLEHRQSDASFDRRMACLEQRKRALDDSLDVLAEIDRGSWTRASEVVKKLPEIASCSYPLALLVEARRPADPGVARQVSAAYDTLSRAKALEAIGRHDDAAELARSVVAQVESLAYPPVVVEANLVLGRSLLWQAGTIAQASAPLRRAMLTGFESGADAQAVEAMARLIQVEQGTSGGIFRDEDEPDDDFALARSLAARVPDAGFLQALLLNNIGTVYLRRGERDTARSYFVQALERASAVPRSQHVELVQIAMNLALATDDRQRADELMAKNSSEREELLGYSHIWTIQARVRHAHIIADPERARTVLQPACTRYQRTYPRAVEEFYSCIEYLAFLDHELGEREWAAAELAEAVPHLREHADDEARDALVGVIEGYSLLYHDRPDAAMAAFHRARDLLPDDETAWLTALRTHVALGLGAAEQAAEHHEAAIGYFERACAELETRAGSDRDMEVHQRLAASRVALAISLWHEAERDRAMQSLERAEIWYHDAGTGYDRPLQRIAELRRAWSTAGDGPANGAHGRAFDARPSDARPSDARPR